MLLLKLSNRVQLSNKSVIQYWMESELLSAHLDINMSEQKLCAHTNKKGLKPALLQHIAMLSVSFSVDHPVFNYTKKKIMML